ncbi:MAG: glycosyltransferase [Phycisphaerales bacterium]
MPTPDKTSPCFVRRHHDWLGVKVFEVVNSPVMAPSIVQFQRPLDEVSSPQLELEVARLFACISPDIVHFHNIEGFSVGCVEAARRAGAKVLFSLHNYHTVCPQVYLMHGHRHVCTDSRGGHACSTCIATKDPAAERRERAASHLLPKSGPTQSQADAVHATFQSAWGGFKHEFSWPVRVVKKSLELLRLRKQIDSMRAQGIGPGALPGRAVDDAPSALEPFPFHASPWDRPPRTPSASPVAVDMKDSLAPEFRSDDHRGQTQTILLEMDMLTRRQHSAHPAPDAHSPFEIREPQPLLNLIQPDPPLPPGVTPNDFGLRRHAMVRMLSSCDQVLAVSNFVRDKFISMGVDPGVIRTLAIGSRINQIVEQGRELVFDPPPFPDPASPPASLAGPPRPIRLVFMGYNNYYKGLHVLARALELFTPEYLARLDLAIYALDGQSIEWVFRRLEPRLARLAFVHGYTYHDIPWILGGKDLGVVPSVWWDNAPQTVFEFFACRVPVLGAAVGGIPDFVVDNHNGLLFRGNDPFDLARRLAEVIRQPHRLTLLRARVTPPKSMDAHARELEALYASLRVRPV